MLDQEILDAQRILAECEGIFCLPASATTLAGLLKFAQRHTFKNQDSIVLVITGSGLKGLRQSDPRKRNHHLSSIQNLDSILRSMLD